ncbi:MAG: pyridoxamine 5'-phosphate oxidase family protein [Spirochaetia bacterium]|nr:pyridoxamine 5'-phosphate oxidase family protein [Spirochaetia bacterium]
MRRKDREISEAEAIEILKKCEFGVLSFIDELNFPYAIPISYAYGEKRIYLHGALEGKKIDLLSNRPQVSFVCVGATHLLPAQFSTNYESAIVIGKGYIVLDEEEKRKGLRALSAKYSPDYEKESEAYINGSLDKTAVIAIEIESITGKRR